MRGVVCWRDECSSWGYMASFLLLCVLQHKRSMPLYNRRELGLPPHTSHLDVHRVLNSLAIQNLPPVPLHLSTRYLVRPPALTLASSSISCAVCPRKVINIMGSKKQPLEDIEWPPGLKQVSEGAQPTVQ